MRRKFNLWEPPPAWREVADRRSCPQQFLRQLRARWKQLEERGELPPKGKTC